MAVARPRAGLAPQHLPRLAAADRAAVYVVYAWGQWQLIQLFPFRVPFLLSPHHRNPYVERERMLAMQDLDCFGEDPARGLAALERQRVRYVVAMPRHESVIASLCGGRELLHTAAGHRLLRLDGPGIFPAMAPLDELPAPEALGLPAGGPAVRGLAPSAEHALRYPDTALPAGRVLELRVQGLAGGPESCLGLEQRFLRAGQPLGVAGAVHRVAGRFDIRLWFIPSPGADTLGTRLTFDPACMAAGQTITIQRVSLAHSAP